VPWAGLAQHLLALVVYPGAVLTLAVGLLAEGTALFAIGRASARTAAVAPIRGLPDSLATSWPLVAGTAVMSMLAATQLAMPLNPVSPLERNLMVAAVALAAAVWLSHGWTWSAPAARVTLVVQACWLVAVLAPAVLSQTLRPQVLGAIALPAQLPLKVLSALLYLVCLPNLLQLVGTGGPGARIAAARVFLWLPFCGLGVSLFVPPQPADLPGALRFISATLVVSLIAIGLCTVLTRRFVSDERSPYLRLAAALAGVVLALAIVSTAIT
jgi:hypothetical protein